MAKDGNLTHVRSFIVQLYRIKLPIWQNPTFSCHARPHSDLLNSVQETVTPYLLASYYPPRKWMRSEIGSTSVRFLTDFLLLNAETCLVPPVVP